MMYINLVFYKMEDLLILKTADLCSHILKINHITMQPAGIEFGLYLENDKNKAFAILLNGFYSAVSCFGDERNIHAVGIKLNCTFERIIHEAKKVFMWSFINSAIITKEFIPNVDHSQLTVDCEKITIIYNILNIQEVIFLYKAYIKSIPVDDDYKEGLLAEI